MSDTEIVICIAFAATAFAVGLYALLKREVRIYRRVSGRREFL